MAGGGEVAVRIPLRHDAVLKDMGFRLRTPTLVWSGHYDREGKSEVQRVGVMHEAGDDRWWFAPYTLKWNPGIKFDTPEAAVSFAEVERWGRADVQGAV